MSLPEALPVVRRTLVLLDAVATRSNGMTFNEIGALFPDIPASTVSRLLKVLLDEEMLEKPDHARNYQLGRKAVRLGKKLCGKINRADLLRPTVTALARLIGHSVAYFELVDHANTLLVKHEIPDAFHYMAEGGSNTSFLRHGGARLLLAYQPDSVLTEIRQRFPAAIDPDSEACRRELQQIRRDGLLINDRDDKPYIVRIAAPVFDGDRFAGALVATLPGAYQRDRLEALAVPVRDAAAQASKILADA